MSTTASEITSTPGSVPIKRHFSVEGIDPIKLVDWEKRPVTICDDRGNPIFTQEHVEVPSQFSDLATKILASKYFYGDLAKGLKPEKGGRESSFKQVVRRVCGTIGAWALEDGYFATEQDSAVFRDELMALCLTQTVAFNSPVWFNLGLYQAYGIGVESASSNWVYDRTNKTLRQARSSYEDPQCSACFIQSVDDTMDSIMELASAEARLFKFGSGSGTDLSSLRSSREKISGGGMASGPLSFLTVYDAVAGVVKSGGKTRRAAKMNTLKAHHPDIEEFIGAKLAEEKKAWALIEQGYDPSFNGDAYGSIKYQNENLSIRAGDAFMQAVVSGESWWTRRVVDDEPCEKKSAAALMDLIAEATHQCGDPGMQFDDTIHRWHTCKGTARQNCTNPCSEFLFLDDSACNLASINLMKFRQEDGEFDYKGFQIACRLLIIAQDILVDRSSYPTQGIAYNSHHFRPLGLGFANLGALLMSLGLGYDTDEGRALAAGITAIMTGAAYCASAEVAKAKGAFDGFLDARAWKIPDPLTEDNRDSMLDVIRLHHDQSRNLSPDCPEKLRLEAVRLWEKALSEGEQYGYRNAQVTVLAPTGTIGFLMDCDTTGIEPAMGLVAYKSLAGGGFLVLPIKTIALALKTLGYSTKQISQIENHIKDFGTIEPVERDGTAIDSGLRKEHYPVFTTAFKSGEGHMFLSYRSHLEMMSAVQPFISGGISKTVNMPKDATVAEIREAYILAWRLGVKGVAIYRDGSKRSAPIKTKKDELKVEEPTKPDQGPTKTAQLVSEPYRRKLPDTRRSLTHKFQIGGSEGYFTIGLFDDGSPGEIFIQMAKAGSTINGLMDTIGILMSLSLQYGVPMETLMKKFSHVRFEPEGMTRNRDIPFAKSVMDYVARFFGMEFVPGYRERMSPAARMVSPSVEDQLEEQTSTGGEEDEVFPRIKVDEAQMEFLTQAQGHLTCPECGSSNVVVTGRCNACRSCGASGGCS
jgi:ribonucleoside-diphosphate reductase alpha chain